MRTHGKLKSWNDDRGFGFIATVRSNDDIFVHISAFPQGGERPQVGEVLSFEVQTDAKGKQRAVRVQRANQSASAKPAYRSKPAIKQKQNTSHSYSKRKTKKEGSSFQTLVSVLIIGAVVYFGYTKYEAYSMSQAAYRSAPESFSQNVTQPAQSSRSRFKCDGRQYCSQMRSREEAVFFIRNCPNTKMDGDHDGIPCENDSRF